MSSDHVGIEVTDYFQSTMTFRVTSSKDDFFSDKTTFDASYFLRIREGRMPTITESREDYCRDNLYQENLSKIVVDRNRVESSVIADLAYLIAGLVTTTQFHVVHRMLQGVEHTDPTEWSTSHLFHWRQIQDGYWHKLLFFKDCLVI